MNRRNIKCPKCTQPFGHPIVNFFFPNIDIVKLVVQDSKAQKYAFKKLFCALLNCQDSKLVIFHVPDCRIINDYDQQVKDMLMSLVPDGCVYHDKFERDYDTNHLWVYVKPSPDKASCILSTLDFHTCFSQDSGLDRKPGHLLMQTFLNSGTPSEINQILPKNDDFTFGREVLIDGQQPFTENVYRQAKGSEQGANGKEPRRWKEKLGEYISAFSKVHGGGTVYFGVDEKKDSGKLTSFRCKGVHLNNNQKERWRSFCKDKVEKMLWVTMKKPGPKPTVNVDFIRPHASQEGCYVIKVTVKQFEGVGFLRKDGPESYKLDEKDKPTEVKPWATWATLSHCEGLVEVSTH